MRTFSFSRFSIALAMAFTSMVSHAQMAQDPLLNTATGVPPNIVFVFDDSGSMDSTGLYQFGGSAGGLGMTGPGNDVGYNAPFRFHDRSPDVNQIYYDPRVRYSVQVNPNGTPKSPGATAGINSFNVYFYNPGTSPVFTVNKVNVVNPGSGYPANVLGTFSLAPSTGRTARATVTTGPSNIVNSVTVNSMGSNYPTTGVVATFSPPPSGGVTATGNVVLVATGKVGGNPNVVSRGSGDYSLSTKAIFSPPGTPGGVTATGNPVVTSQINLASVPVTNPGTGVTGSPTITFNAPPVSGTQGTGVRATGTVLTNTLYRVASAPISAGGSGYTSAPTVVFSGAPVGTAGVAASGTAVLSAPVSYSARVGTATVTATGTTCTNGTRAITINGTGGSGAAGTGTYSGGRLTSVTITSTGSGYTSATFSATTSGCATNGTRTLPGSLVATYYGVASITITNAGTGYLNPPGITLTGGGGSGATATVNTTTFTGVTGISVTNPGSGYTATGGGNSPSIASSTGLGGATFGAVVTGTSNVITGLTITNPGSGYTAAPTVTLVDTGTGTGASFAVAAPATTRGISGITMTNKGSGYTSPPTVTITFPPLGGTATVQNTIVPASFTTNLAVTNIITGVTVTDPGAGYKVAPRFSISAASGSPVGDQNQFAVVTDSTLDNGVNTNWAGNGTPTTIADYFNPSYLPDAGSALAENADPAVVYPNVADGSVSKFPKFKERTDCVSAASGVKGTEYCTWSEELQNYANWKTYHSTRLMMAKTGVGLAFQPLGPSFRLGWGTINNINNSSNLASGVRLFDSSNSTDFLNWLYAIPTNGGTPNRNAINKVGQYFTRADDGGPWAKEPEKATNRNSTNPSSGAANPDHAICRRNYTILMTDGYYNETFSTPDSDTKPGQLDGAGIPYLPIGPYSDTASGTPYANSFADIAHRYWLNSLRPDFKNQKALQAISSDTATWPHMNFFAIGLGISGTLDAFTTVLDSDGKTFINPVKEALSEKPGKPRTLDWPAPQANNPRAIDDMWHATINGRGQFLNAGTAEKLRNAVGTIVSAISGIQSSQAGVAVSAVELTNTTRKYTPTFIPGDWAGNVKAFNLSSGSGDEAGIAWEVESTTTNDPDTGKPIYVSLIPDFKQRKIYVGTGTNSGTRAVDFDFASMGGLLSDLAGPNPVNVNLVNYLRGDASNEATDKNALISSAIYRVRQTRLGDIVNSTPTFVKTSVDLNYDQLGAGDYRAFVNNKVAKRQEGVLFVGANDGMLHAFRDGNPKAGGNTVTPSEGGIEVFAFVPNALLPAMNNLSKQGYAHQYYVDGPLTETDTYLPAAGTWANMVLGTTGGGAGKPSKAGTSPLSAVFAINTTALTDDVTALNASNVQWEVSSKMTGFEELGYVLNDVQAGPTADGSWVAIFGNGYESASCKAQLFVVNIETGALVRRIDTNAGSCGSGRNGLGGVRLVRDSKGIILGAYAGDLLGNVWKFDLSATDKNAWKIGFDGDPLFKTATNQPITAPPTVVDLSTTPATTLPKPGYMVVVGTGKFFETVDRTSTDPQTLIGIWDKELFGAPATGTGNPVVSKSDLVEQTVKVTSTYDLNGNKETSVVATSKNKVDYEGGKKGWYFDFPNSGQRLVYPMELLANRFVAVDSISPEGVSTDPCAGGVGGKGFFYIFDALSGAAPKESVLGLDPLKDSTGEEMFPNGFSTRADGRNVSIKLPGIDEKSQDFVILSTDPKGIKVSISCNLTETCKAPAEKVLKSREWRQLFPR